MKISRRKEKRCNGFTLVELIVVLVILAVLAALLVPALTGYIDKANEASVIAEARAVLTAAQAVTSEAYAKELLPPTTENGNFARPAEASPNMKKMAKQIYVLAEADPNRCSWQFALPSNPTDTLPAAKISIFSYCNGKYCVTYHLVGNSDLDILEGWGEVERRSTLPTYTNKEDQVFLASSDYNPKLPL